jgi:hypothetical protein
MSEAHSEYLGVIIDSAPALAVRESVDDVDLTRCYYCGEPATSIDHVIPQTMLRALATLEDEDVTAVLVRFNRRLTVPCCGECNSSLSNSYQDTLAKRKAELKRRMRRRYRRLLRMPEWSDRELSQLHGRLRDWVIASVVKREIILRRLAY